jgi:hypothetical protein
MSAEVSIPDPEPKELIIEEPVPAVLGAVFVVDVIAIRCLQKQFR